MTNRTFIIVGASLCGAKAAEELRTQGFDGRIVLIGSEPERPYERPPLSKDYLRGESVREKIYVHPADFYADNEIDLEVGRTVTALDATAHTVMLDDGRSLNFDRLLLSNGAEPRRIAVDGSDLAGIHYLRTVADCDLLRARLDAGGHVVVVGAGWIGSEFAASARQRGLEVTLVDPLALPNERIFGPQIGSFYRDVHAQHGVELVLGDVVQAFLGDGEVARVLTEAGREIECDFAVVGIGAEPRIQLARDAGLTVENGIVVDEKLQTSAPSVFAAGDVARAWHPFYREGIRIEHWSNALNQGPAAARAMVGESTSYDRIPYFFSDQYDVGMEYSGYATSWDEVLFRGSPDDGAFIAFWMKDQRVIAGMNVNIWDVNPHVQALIRSREALSPDQLTDPDIPLESMVAAPRSADVDGS